MSVKYKVGVVGTGGIFREAHKGAWLQHPEAEIVQRSEIYEVRQ